MGEREGPLGLMCYVGIKIFCRLSLFPVMILGRFSIVEEGNSKRIVLHFNMYILKYI